MARRAGPPGAAPAPATTPVLPGGVSALLAPLTVTAATAAALLRLAGLP